MKSWFSESNRKIVIGIVAYAVFSLILAYSIPEVSIYSWVTGHLLGLFAVLFHLLSSSYSGKKSGKKFLKTYFWSLFLRFLVVCILFALIIIWTNIEEISFTFSFVISYLYHSVIEVVLLNKKLSD